MNIQSKGTAGSNRLSKGLLKSHLSVAMLGVLLLLGALATTLWLRNSAVNLTTISGPRTEAVVKLQAGMQRALANLHGWMALPDIQFKQQRQLAWDNEIRPSLARIQQLARLGKPMERTKLIDLERAFDDLDMWQWRIEDVAQSAGNFPATIILDIHSQPMMLRGTTAVTALIELSLLQQKPLGLPALIKLRESWHLADGQLKDYIISHREAGYSEYHRLITITLTALRDYQQTALYLKHSSSQQTFQQQAQQDQFTLISNALQTYQAIAIEALEIQQSGQRNIANELLKQQAIPLASVISQLLNEIAVTEQTTMRQDVKSIQRIGSLTPWIMLVLMVLMVLMAFYLAKKGIRQFIAPVHELEWQNQLKTDIARLNGKMQGDLTVPLLSEQVISSLCQKVNAAAGAIYIVDEPFLRVEASYVLAMDQLPKHIKQGEQLIGQAWKDACVMEMNASAYGLSIKSPLLNVTPHSVLVLPVSFEGEVIAVIELLALQSFTTKQREYLDKAVIKIGLALHNVIQNMQIKDTLLETQNLAEELQAQQEELSTSNEELQSQQEELRLSNEQLSDRSDELTAQSSDLELARLEAEEKAQKLAETSRYKSEFLANMSHELRTPLNSILILAQHLAQNDDGHLSDSEVESATVIEDSGKNLLNLINDILDISKTEAGKMLVHQDPIIVNELSTHVMLNFKHMAEERGISLACKVDESLPEIFETDSTKLKQILTNLISNALKFTHEGGVTLTISSCPVNDIMQRANDVQSANLISFAVHDTGVGIAEDKHQLVFQAFQQADGSTTRNYGGTGLGLSIALTHAQLLGGDIRLHSEEGKGSTFTLYLPLVEPQREAVIETPAASQSALPPDEKTEGLMSILIVEDDSVAQLALDKLAQTMPLKLTSVTTAKQALEALSDHHYNVMLLDLSLPGMKADELLETISADNHLLMPHIIIYTEKELSIDEQTKLRRYTDKVIMKSANSAQRLTDEIKLFIRNYNNPTQAEQIESTTSIDLSGTKILLVDDDMRNIFTLSKVLTEKGMKVQMAPSGKVALEHLQESAAYDLVLMDIMMPEMDGYQTMTEIRQRLGLKDIPIIALTAKAMPGDKDKCLQAGANDYLAKPVDIAKLMTLMQLWL